MSIPANQLEVFTHLLQLYLVAGTSKMLNGTCCLCMACPVGSSKVYLRVDTDKISLFSVGHVTALAGCNCRVKPL